jgi:hypothetical protein
MEFVISFLIALVAGFLVGTHYGPHVRMRARRRFMPEPPNRGLRNYQDWKAKR